MLRFLNLILSNKFFVLLTFLFCCYKVYYLSMCLLQNFNFGFFFYQLLCILILYITLKIGTFPWVHGAPPNLVLLHGGHVQAGRSLCDVTVAQLSRVDSLLPSTHCKYTISPRNSEFSINLFLSSKSYVVFFFVHSCESWFKFFYSWNVNAY